MRTITLHPNGTGRYEDVSPFIVTDNSLRLNIKLPNFNGEFYFVAENNGVTAKKLIPRDGAVTLDKLTAGELNGEVKHYLKGALIKVYKIEPLLLKEIDGSLSAMPEIEALSRRIAAAERSLAEYKEEACEVFDSLKGQIQSLEAQCGEMIEAIEKLIVFAYADFKENVYLGGGTKEEFTEKYGLNPDIKQGEENND